MSTPLAERMRPKNLDEFVGQKQLVAQGAVLRNVIVSVVCGLPHRDHGYNSSAQIFIAWEVQANSIQCICLFIGQCENGCFFPHSLSLTLSVL